MKANRIVLLSLLMLSILVSGCGTSAPNSSETYESTIVETTETIQMPEAVYEFPVIGIGKSQTYYISPFGRA